MVIESDTFDRLPIVSYNRPVVTLSVKCTVFEMATHWSKIAEKPTQLSFGTFLRCETLRI